MHTKIKHIFFSGLIILTSLMIPSLLVHAQAPIDVLIYSGPASSGNLLTRVTANQSRPDVNAVMNVSGDHGFSWPVPQSLYDGIARSIYVYGVNNNSSGQNTLLTNSPMTIQCAAPVVASVPAVTLISSPTSVSRWVGGTVNLIWSTSGADSCVASGDWSGAKPVNGSEDIIIYPFSSEKTYTLTCSNSSGSTMRSVTVGVGGDSSAPTIAITSPTPSSQFSVNTSVPITATASDSDGSITRVDFYNGTTLISSDTTAPYTASFTSSSGGAELLRAVATDNANLTTEDSVWIFMTEGNTCQSSTATNYGGALPCVWPSGNCAVIGSANYGEPLPCIPSEFTCNDPSASNFGAFGACMYTEDVCPNITGVQGSIPNGYVMNTSGDCVPNGLDWCPNISGIQSNVPSGMTVLEDGTCVLVDPPQCADGNDNDNDGKVDMVDPGCANSSDDTENTDSPVCTVNCDPAQCSDGLDNDGDGLIDLADPQCANADDNNESATGCQGSQCGLGGDGGPGGNVPGGSGGNISGFTVSGASRLAIQFVANNAATSQSMNLSVNPVLGFSLPVTLSVESIRTAGGTSLPADVTPTYYFDGNPSPTVLMTYNPSFGQYTNPGGTIGTLFAVKLSKKITEKYYITIMGTSGAKQATFVIELNPNAVNPEFREI